jgi:hypothetical protein
MTQYIAIVKLIINSHVFKGGNSFIGLTLYGNTKEEALKTLNTSEYDFVVWNSDYKGKDLLVKII